MSFMQWFDYFTKQRWFLWSLFWINFLGTIYGYYWYRNQIAITTPKYLLPFVPDSPTASLFFTLVLLFLLFGKKTGFIAAFAAITSFKYGIWAIAAILWGAALGDTLRPDHYMLMVSHGGMAVEALLFYKFYRIKIRDLVFVSIWTLMNDALDYGLDIHPWVSNELEVYDHLLGWFTLALSIVSIIIVYQLTKISSRLRVDS